MLTTLLLGALFCWGNLNVGAYTYSGQNITVTAPNENEDELIVTGNSNITSNNTIQTQKKKTETIYKPTAWTGAIEIWSIEEYESGTVRRSKWGSLPNNPTEQDITSFNNQQGYVIAKKNADGTISLYHKSTNKELTSTIIGEWSGTGWDDNADGGNYTETVKVTGGTMHEGGNQKITTNLGDAAITVTGNSSLTGKAGVQTTKAINVNTNSKLTAAGAINAGSITAEASTITGASITNDNELIATNGSTISATDTITTGTLAIKSNSKIQAKNLTTNLIFIDENSILDISKGTLMIIKKDGEWDSPMQVYGKIKAKFLKVKNTNGTPNGIGSNTYITGGLTLKGKAQTISAGAANTDVINKVQMTTALNNAKPKLGKTYSAGTGINLNTNNAVGLTNATAYTTSDKKRISLVGAAKTDLKKVKAGKVSATSKDLINGSQLYTIQQSIAGFADRIQTNKNQLETLKSSINAKKTELSGIQKSLNTIKGTKLSQDMSNLTTDGEAVIKNQVQKAIQKFQKDMDVSTVQTNVQEAKISDAMKAKPTESYKPSYIMLADAPIKATNEPVNAVSAISKEDVAAKADLTQTKVNLEKKATLDTMDVSAYTKQLSKGLATGESAHHAIQEAKENRLVQAKGNTLTVGANGAETKIDASKKNWTGILVDEKEAGSMANVGYVDQTLSMESSYDRLSLMKKDLEKDTNKGIAKAAALAALKPIGHDEEDKVSFSIGYGHYKDGNAAAIGTFYRPNQDVLIHLDVTAGAGKPGMNTGVSFKIGKGSSYASMTREQLAEENAAMKDQAKKQAERIQTQKGKIEHLESVIQSIRF